MPAAPSLSYLKTKVATSSPAELRMLLLDGAIRFAEHARAGYERKDFEAAFDGTTKCQGILTELMCSLRPERNADLCGKLSALYTFMYRRMVEASMSKDAAIVEEVIGLLQYERETWQLLMQQLASQSTASLAGASSQPDASSATGAPGAVSGVSASRVSVQG